MMKIKTKAIIFDMDGVITNTMPDHYRVWKKIFAQQGIRVSRLDVYRREGEPGINSVLEILKEHKIPVDQSKAKKILSRKEQLFKKVVKKRFIVGARQFLRSLHKANFKLALVTGTSRHELHRILPDYLYNLFDVTVTGNDVRRGKPNPEPYQKALKKLNVDAREGVVIENAPFGIQSAKGAKVRCLAIRTSLPEGYVKDADAVFLSIKDLRKRVRFFNEA